MEEPDSIDSYPTSEYSQKRLVTETRSVLIQNQTNSGKFLSNFIYKSIFVVILVAFLPFLSSQAPELFADALLIRIWDLVHLLLVGIAISYGLFSRKNTESDKGNRLKNDSDHAYSARILRISSVLEDEIESPLSFYDNKMGSWSSMYFPEEPDVIFEENSYGDSVGSRKKIRNKIEPLSLPVRRLKSRIFETEEPLQNMNEIYESINRTSSGLRGTSSTEVLDSKGSGDLIFEQMKMEQEEKASVVLPSPIPWRSRSGRIKEVKDELLKPDRIKNEQESQKNRSNITRSTIHLATEGSISPKKLSPRPSMEPHATISEDYVKKKKKIYASSPPPPPPPPPLPPVDWRHSSANANPSTHRNEERLKKSSKDRLKNFSINQSNAASEEALRINSSSIKEKSKATIDNRIPGKSVRTIRPSNGTRATMEYEQDQKKTPDRIISDVTEDSKNRKSYEEEAEDGDVNEVNKKDDEFIAKFREQIRLQRIESIKRSSEQRIANKSR